MTEQFAGFSSDSFAERIIDCEAKILVTADGVWRGEKFLGLKAICDQAMDKCARNGHNVECCIVVSHLCRVTSPTSMQQNKKVLCFSYSILQHNIYYIKRK